MNLLRKKKEKPTYKKNGKIPTQSRVFIDYTWEKPKVKFEYIRKQQAIDNYSGLTGMYIWAFIILFTVTAGLYITFIAQPAVQGYPVNCSVAFLVSNSSWIDGYNITCIDSKNESISQVFYYNYAGHRFERHTKGIFDELCGYQNMKWWIVCVIDYILMILLFGFSKHVSKFIYTHAPPGFRKRLDRNHQKYIERAAKQGTKPKYKWVFKECPKDNVIEIPVFRNRYIGYLAEGDFGKYLSRIEIKEHPFMMKIRKSSKRKRSSWAQNDSYFYARFMFSKNPKNGQLKLEWK